MVTVCRGSALVPPGGAPGHEVDGESLVCLHERVVDNWNGNGLLCLPGVEGEPAVAVPG